MTTNAYQWTKSYDYCSAIRFENINSKFGFKVVPTYIIIIIINTKFWDFEINGKLISQKNFEISDWVQNCNKIVGKKFSIYFSKLFIFINCNSN